MPTDADTYLPSYNEPLGVWYLSTAPTIVCTNYYWFNTFMELQPQNNKIAGAHYIRTVYTFDGVPKIQTQ